MASEAAKLTEVLCRQTTGAQYIEARILRQLGDRDVIVAAEGEQIRARLQTSPAAMGVAVQLQPGGKVLVEGAYSPRHALPAVVLYPTAITAIYPKR